MSVDTPNVVIPLASSYNERGVQGYTNSTVNGLDQRKINSIYKPVKNSITGNSTLYLCKRPGVVIDSGSYGTSGQVGYLVVIPPASNTLASVPWVLSTSGNDVRASSGVTTTVIATAVGSWPAYVDKTAVSGADTVVVQIRDTSAFAQSTYFSTAIGTWTAISDGDFTGLSIRGKMEHMDGYAFVLDSMNRVYNSDVNSLANWTAGNFITKQITQDQPRQLARFNDQILAFGDETVEGFTNNGNPSGSPLVTQKSLFHRIGMQVSLTAGQTHYYTVLNDKMYFIGRRAGGGASVGIFAYNGSGYEKVSTPFIDGIVSEINIYSVNKIGFHGQMAVAFALDLPSATTQRWLMFFPEWNEWFEWNSTVFMPANNGNYFIGVGANQHRVYKFANASSDFSSTDTWQDNGTNYTQTHQFKLPKRDTARNVMAMCGVKADTARSANSINVEFSDDDWQSFQSARAIDMTLAKKQLYRCGSYSDRGVRLTNTGNFEGRMESFYARVT